MRTHVQRPAKAPQVPAVTPISAGVRGVSGVLQRACSCQGSGAHGDCEECKAKRVQRVSTGPSGPSIAPPIVHDVLRSSGQPLDDATRAYFEPRFGHDFSKVRVHTDSRAAESARSVNALAYTVGRDLVFESGKYQPATLEGKSLLAHELTHVVQQGGRAAQGPLEVGDPHDAFEREAGRMAATVSNAAGQATSASNEARAPLRVQRLGPNPTCTQAEADDMHQAIYDARGWLNNAVPKLETDPLTPNVLSALRRNFGPIQGGAANAGLIHDRLKVVYRHLATNTFACDTAGAGFWCGQNRGGESVPGSNVSTICTNPPSTLSFPTYRVNTVLHECLHATFDFMTVDNYKTNPGFPGAGADPLRNPESYAFLVQELS